MESIVLQRRRTTNTTSTSTTDGGALAALAELCDYKDPGGQNPFLRTTTTTRTVMIPLSLITSSSSTLSSSTSTSPMIQQSSSYIKVMADHHHHCPPPQKAPTPITPQGTPNNNNNMVREILSASLSLAELAKSPVVFHDDEDDNKTSKEEEEEVVGSAATMMPSISSESSSVSSSSSSSSSSKNNNKLAILAPLTISIQPRTQPRATRVPSSSPLPTTTSSSRKNKKRHPSSTRRVSKTTATIPTKGASSSSSSSLLDEATTTTTATTNNNTVRFRKYQVTTWSQRLEDVQAFVRKHGHCMIPSDYPPNQKLAKWAKRQRCQYQLFQSNPSKSSMTLERISVLEDLGFCWQNKMSVWQARYQELLQFHLQFGHTQVPSSYKPNQRLATWVKCQRRQKRLRDRGKPSSMTDDRIALLDSVHFVWRMYPSNPRAGGGGGDE